MTGRWANVGYIRGPEGKVGPGVAPGGTEGQLLESASELDFHTRWTDPQWEGGGSRWWFGHGPPDWETYGEYDFYLDLDTGDVWVFMAVEAAPLVSGVKHIELSRLTVTPIVPATA